MASRLATLCVVLQSSAVTAKGVAIVAVGANAEAAGRLQIAVENGLATQAALTLQTIEHVSQRLGVRPATEDLAAVRAEIAHWVDAGRRALLDDQFVKAQEHLDLAIALQTRDRAPDPGRFADMQLWRASVAIALAQPDAARRFVEAALLLKPDLTVDLAVFKPSLRKVVETERSRLGELLHVQLRTAPAQAQVLLDGRVVQHDTRTFAGRHHVTARAPGCRDVSLELERLGPQIEVYLPVRLDSTLERALDDLLWQPRIVVPAREILADVATRLNVACPVVVGTSDQGVRAILGCEPFSASPVLRGNDALVQWLRAAFDAGPAAALQPATPPRTAPAASLWQWRLAGSIVTSVLQPDIIAKDSRGWRPLFVGAGGRAALELDQEYGIGAVGRVQWTSFALSNARVVSSVDSDSDAVPGGQLASFDLAVRYRFATDSRLHVACLAGVLAQLYEASPLAPDGLLRSTQRLGPLFGVDTDVGLSTTEWSGPVSVGATFSLVPWHTTREDPEVSGELDTRGGGELRLRLTTGETWKLQLSLGQQLFYERYRGLSTLPIEPSLRGVRHYDWLSEASLTLLRTL